MRRILRVWVPIILLGVCLTLVYFRQWIMTARSISAMKELQKADVQQLSFADESLREIASLQMALRVKLFGPQGAESEYLPQPGTTGMALPSSVVHNLQRHGVKLVFYRNRGVTSQAQFEGPYDGLIRFLESSGPDLPQVEGFWMERTEKNQVKLTLTFPTASV